MQFANFIGELCLGTQLVLCKVVRFLNMECVVAICNRSANDVQSLLDCRGFTFTICFEGDKE